MRRKNDPIDYNFLRNQKNIPEQQVMAAPGTIVIPDTNTAIGAMATSSVVVTIFDLTNKKGGLCHFIKPKPGKDQPGTPIFGLPAIWAMLKNINVRAAQRDRYIIGVYGGGCPDWANQKQKALAAANIEIAKKVLLKKGLIINYQDVGERQARKIIFISATNEVIIARTDSVRKTDWFSTVEI